MTTDNYEPVNLDDLEAESNETLRLAHEILDRCNRDRAEQPKRLAAARGAAEEARGWSLIEEPWSSLITAIPAHDEDGYQTGGSLVLPSITAKELFAARMAFDMLDAGLDAEANPEAIDDAKNRYFALLNGDPGLLFLVCMAALDTIATLVVPQLVDELETRASNYDVRVMLAEARTKSWNGRVSELRGAQDNPTSNEFSDEDEPW
ncbi:hypothetical protein ACXPWS_13550 [Mycobacterium sp. BMJ-28]